MTLPSLTGVRGVAALWVVLFHLQLFGKEFGLRRAVGDADPALRLDRRRPVLRPLPASC